jgi:hypothetical protein
VSLFPIVLGILPLAGGVSIAAAKPDEAVEWINSKSAWWESSYQAAKLKDGFFASLWRWLIWGVHKLHALTEGTEDSAVRAGVRLALFFYILAFSLFVLASLIYLAIVLVLIVAGLWIVAKILNAGNGDTEHRDSSQRRPIPGAARGGQSRKRTDFWGKDYTEHRDEEGNIVGSSRVKKDFWGNTFVERRDVNGDVEETSRARQDFWGNEYTEHRDAQGDKSGESRAREDFWGNDYVEHRDEEGDEVGRSTPRKDFWGNDYVEHEPKE